MIEPNLSGLSVSKQCALLSISRSSFYYEPKGETEMNLDLMRLIDKQFLETPFYGVSHPRGRFALQIACRAIDDMAFAR
jgi:putative transposase